MEASNKDLARARFKQQRRDAFRDGRGRGGRGRGRGRSGPFDDVDADEAVSYTHLTLPTIYSV